MATAATLAACHSAPPAPPPPPPPLSDSAAAALRWVQARASIFAPEDSTASPAERAALYSFVGNARVIGFSELSEGTHEFPYLIRRTLFALADSGVRALAIQGPMPEAMEVDRYVRTGQGDLRRILRGLGSWRWETREMQALVVAMRDWNKTHGPNQQLGFYGFEIPTAAHAINVITSLPDSVLGKSLKSYLVHQYACVGMNEGAHWGLEGRAADSTFWSSCGPATVAAADSVDALRHRIPASSRWASDVAFADEMAQLVRHHVSIGLKHLTRQDANAEHVLYLANLAGPNAKLMLWGGDFEMGRLTADRTTVQTGVALQQRLGDRYRNVAFAFGTGSLRARVPANRPMGGGDQPGLSTPEIARPQQGTYEDVLSRAGFVGYLLDVRHVGTPGETGSGWMRGPHQMRLIIEVYAPQIPQSFETPIELPAYFDGIAFVNRVTPAR